MAGDWNAAPAAIGSSVTQTKPGTVTVTGKPGADVPPGTLANILRQAQLKGPRT
jgi:HicA-like toxin of HicAB toxin-antitoxin system